MTYTICKTCGWIHFSVTQKYVDEENEKWKKYVKTLTTKQVKDFYGGSTEPYEYEKCFRCEGSYKNTKKATKKDLKKLGIGHTIQPILHYNE
jgi:heterodisulfide reductase subunit B